MPGAHKKDIFVSFLDRDPLPDNDLDPSRVRARDDRLIEVAGKVRSVSLILPGHAACRRCRSRSCLYLMNVLAGLFPVFMLLRRTPAQIPLNTISDKKRPLLRRAGTRVFQRNVVISSIGRRRTHIRLPLASDRNDQYGTVACFIETENSL